MKNARRMAAAACAMSLAFFVPAKAPAAEGGIVGPLHTRGNKIYDSANRPVILRGVVAEWLNRFPFVAGSGLDDTSADVLRQWGATLVRVPLGQQYWVSSECEYLPIYASMVDQVVQTLTSRGIVALLDLHWSTGKKCWPAGMQWMPDERSITFWSEVAARYKDNPLVAFQLYNEPHSVSWDVWRNGGPVYDPKKDWIAPGMQQLYNTVRSTGARNLVFVSGNNWAGYYPPSSKYLIRGYNIVYAYHNFACAFNPPPNCRKGPVDRNNIRWIDRWTPFIRQQPVVLTEFGWPDPNDGRFNRSIIAWAESRHIGWTVYNWGVGTPTVTRWGLLRDMVTYEPAASGVPVKEALTLHRPN